MNDILYDLNCSFLRIQKYLDLNRPSFSALLQDGLTLNEITEFSNSYHVSFPVELVELYKWRNGAKTYHEQFRPGYRFIPLKEALEHRIYISRDDNQFFMFDGVVDMKSCLLPIFSYDHESLSVLCKDGDVFHSQVIRSDGSCHYLYTSSLTNLIKVMVDCFESGLYSFETYEERLENLILQKYQPELIENAFTKVLKAEKELSGELMAMITPFVGIYADSRAIEVLIRILFLSHDKHTEGCRIEKGTALALGMISNSTTIDALILALQSPYEVIRDAAINPLVQVCGSNVIPFLISALKITNEFVQEVIQQALTLRRSIAIDELIGALDNENNYARLSAVKVLGSVAKAYFRDTLSFGYSITSSEDQKKIIKHLDYIILSLIGMKGDPVSEIRDAAENCLKFRESF